MKRTVVSLAFAALVAAAGVFGRPAANETAQVQVSLDQQAPASFKLLTRS